MENNIESPSTETLERTKNELYLRYGNEIFDVLFLNLFDARKVADRLATRTGLDVEIFDHKTGAVFDRYSGR
jgi:hypothetical protein